MIWLDIDEKKFLVVRLPSALQAAEKQQRIKWSREKKKSKIQKIKQTIVSYCVCVAADENDCPPDWLNDDVDDRVRIKI